MTQPTISKLRKVCSKVDDSDCTGFECGHQCKACSDVSKLYEEAYTALPLLLDEVTKLRGEIKKAIQIDQHEALYPRGPTLLKETLKQSLQRLGE